MSVTQQRSLRRSELYSSASTREKVLKGAHKPRAGLSDPIALAHRNISERLIVWVMTRSRRLPARCGGNCSSSSSNVLHKKFHSRLRLLSFFSSAIQSWHWPCTRLGPMALQQRRAWTRQIMQSRSACMTGLHRRLTGPKHRVALTMVAQGH